MSARTTIITVITTAIAAFLVTAPAHANNSFYFGIHSTPPVQYVTYAPPVAPAPLWVPAPYAYHYDHCRRPHRYGYHHTRNVTIVQHYAPYYAPQPRFHGGRGHHWQSQW